MRKLLLALAALAAVGHRGSVRLRLEPPRGTGHLARPVGGQHGHLRVDGEGRSRRPDDRGRLDPRRGAGQRPEFLRFDDRARYYIHIDNTGDGRPDVSYRFRSRPRSRNKNSFLYALPGASGYNDPKLNVDPALLDRPRARITATARRSTSREDDRARAAGRAAQHRPEDVPELRDVREWGHPARSKDGTKVFVGQRDDPFFVDLGATFDAINVRKLTGNQGEGKDDLSGLQRPLDRPADPGAAGDHATTRPSPARTPANAVVGVWSTTERRRLQVAGTPRKRHGHTTAAGSRSRASATRWSTRSSSRSARRTSSTARRRTVTPRSTASTSSSRSWRRS